MRPATDAPTTAIARAQTYGRLALGVATTLVSTYLLSLLIASLWLPTALARSDAHLNSYLTTLTDHIRDIDPHTLASLERAHDIDTLTTHITELERRLQDLERENDTLQRDALADLATLERCDNAQEPTP